MPCGQSVFQGLAERATFPVHQIPPKGQRNKTTGPATTSTLPSAQEQCAGFHISAVNASSWAIVSNSVSNIKLKDHQHWPQLNIQTFQPVTPIQADKLEQLLADHPNQQIIKYVIKGFRERFSLKYKRPRLNRQPKNSN